MKVIIIKNYLTGSGMVLRPGIEVEVTKQLAVELAEKGIIKPFNTEEEMFNKKIYRRIKK